MTQQFIRSKFQLTRYSFTVIHQLIPIETKFIRDGRILARTIVFLAPPRLYLFGYAYF